MGPSLLGRTLGHLRVVDQLGETPEGTLYRGEYSTGLEVAVLALRSDERNGPNGLERPVTLLRLQQQLSRAIQIKHPNVAAVYEVGETSDRLVYIVMERLTGELLSDILAAHGALPLNQALDWSLQAAAGLQAAHKVGLVHGNLSPGAILITEAGGQTCAKIIRFTPASSSEDFAPKPIYTAPVTPGYASPERLSGHPPDQRGDVFSLGAVLHHLLTGTAPEGARLGPVPPVIRTVLARALAWDPAQRFETVAEFAGALEGVALAVASTPEGTTTNRALVRKLAGAGLVAVTVAVLWMAWSWWRSPESEARPVPETITRAPPVEGRTPPRLSPAAAAPRQSSPITGRPTNSARSGSNPPSPKTRSAVATPGPGTDSVRRPKYVSPFRRSHPWAAVPGQRFYFRSTCRVALQAPELVYFKSADEARARGLVPSPIPGCR